MKTLCFGGSFNPIHNAHLICSRLAAESAGFDRVLLIPNRLPPHKRQSTAIALPEDRLAMCRLAAATQDDLFEVDDLELRRTGPSFTLDTVIELKSRGWKNVTWLIGADMLADLPHWYQAPTLVHEVDFLVMARPGWTIDTAVLGPVLGSLRVGVAPTPLLDISATMIRGRCAKGQSIRAMVPDAVADYIATHGLYRKPRRAKTPAGIERE